jgi:hypothetical protein
MRMKQVGNKREDMVGVILNGGLSTIPLGAPVIYKLTSTANDNDGVSVGLPSASGGAANYQLCAGVNQTYNLAVGYYGEAMIFGYCPTTLVKLNTRAATTDTWASVAAVASGVLLVPDFTNDVWQTLANVAAVSSPQCILVDAIGAVGSAASNAKTGLVSTGLYRSFVRMM